MHRRKICVVTGSRADYGLLYWVLKRLQHDKSVELQLCVTGMHLSSEFGFTYRQIEEDGFIIRKKIEMSLLSDNAPGITKSMSEALSGFGRSFYELQPDVVVLLGDRFEIFAAATAALISGVPIAHCHGGEVTEGAYDESLRHAITKMSHIHFTATHQYRNRVIQLGENPDFVFVVGALGIENIKKLKLLSRKNFEKSAGFKLGQRNLLVTYHPATTEKDIKGYFFEEILNALETLQNTKIIFTKTNADNHGRVINRLIDEFVQANQGSTISFTSMGQLLYLSAMQFVDAVVGNSSSGIIEAPSFKTGTINIGNRQTGRIKALSIIDCPPRKQEILNSIDQLYSIEYQKQLERVTNPYDVGFKSEGIVSILKSIDTQKLIKKTFFDLPGVSSKE